MQLSIMPVSLLAIALVSNFLTKLIQYILHRFWKRDSRFWRLFPFIVAYVSFASVALSLSVPDFLGESLSPEIFFGVGIVTLMLALALNQGKMALK